MMEQDNNPESGAASLSEQTRTPSVGQRLREARERQGLSVDDVIAKIKLAPRQIIALEADDFQALPETAFVRGFVRSYAKLLQLDAQSLLDDLPGAQVAKVEVEANKVEAPFPSERTARRQNLNLLIAALLITVVIAGFAVWQVNAPVKTVEAPAADAAMVETPLPLPEQVEVLDASGVPDVASAVPEVVAVQSAVPQVEPVKAAPTPLAVVQVASSVQPSGKTSVLRLTFDKDAWVDIRDKYGKPLTNHLNRSGTELRVEGIAPFALVVGHATSVHLYSREKQVDMTPYVNASSEVARLTVE